MAAARAPAASLRFVSLINFFLVVLSHPGQSHLPLSAANAAMGALSYEELTTSLVVNQLAIVQMMQNVSDASCAVAEMGRQEARRADEAEELVAKLEALLKPHLQQAVEAGLERRLQEVLEAITNQISTTFQDTLATVAEMGRQEARRADEAEEQAAKLEALLKPHLQQAVETVEAGHERRLQEVLEAITNQISTTAQDTLATVAEMGRQEARRADEAEEQAAKLEALQQAVETVEAVHERRLQEVLEAITNQISTTAQDTLASMAELREEIRLEKDRSLGAREPEQEATPTEATPAFLATIVHNDTQPSLCSGAKFLVGSIGSLEVVKNDNYPSGLICSWNITLPVKAPLSLTWEYIDMEPHSSCNYDWVKVNDLSNGGASVFGAGLCGTLSPSMLKMLSVVLPPTKNILVSFPTAPTRGEDSS
ncbi:inner centromere protein-like isoform X7 [Eriocheir sinensis]|uniref:inner centromere protein-like isoform X7 n=1 Tax=Eriocheir sinensis TaxID=95602 RepID=UPI0021C56BE8|nr:inner centromere protein-like isoform X7 [Eriocheir sinensis]